MWRYFLALICALLLTGFANANTNFLEMGLRNNFGVRALGMGSAFTAIADDASAGYFNPAGIPKDGFQYYIESTDYQNQALAIANNYIFQWQNVIYSDWHHRDKAGNDLQVNAISYGQSGPSGWGFSYKRIISNLQADGYTIDFGILMSLGQELKWGFLAQDLFKDNVEVRTTLRSGLSMRLLENRLLCAIDEEFYRGPDPQFLMHYGAEYNLTEAMDIRAGWSAGNFTGGISLVLDFGTLEYAIATNSDLNQSSQHSIAICFGRKRSAHPPPPKQGQNRQYFQQLRQLPNRYQR